MFVGILKAIFLSLTGKKLEIWQKYLMDYGSLKDEEHEEEYLG